jgi:hypothetical protein
MTLSPRFEAAVAVAADLHRTAACRLQTDNQTTAVGSRADFPTLRPCFANRDKAVLRAAT